MCVYVKIMNTDFFLGFMFYSRISFTLENETVIHWCTRSQYISNLNSILENETFKVILRNHRILSDSPDYLLRKCSLSLSRVKLYDLRRHSLHRSLSTC